MSTDPSVANNQKRTQQTRTKLTRTQPTRSTQQTRRNAQTALAAGPRADDACSYCERRGVPILPLRYAIVPSLLDRGGRVDPSSYPGLKLGRRSAQSEEKNLLEPLRANRYALRTLRRGFVMIYFGERQWDGYAVDSQGHLRQIPRPALDRPALADTYLPNPEVDPTDRKVDALPSSCRAKGHHIPASFIHIPEVILGGRRSVPQKFWIAFTAVPWTPAVRRLYEGSGEAARRRAARMQVFDTPRLQTDADSVDDAFLLADATKGERRLHELVFEMAADAQQARIRSTLIGNDPTAMKQPHPAERRWVGAHGVAMRTGQQRRIAAYAAEYGIDGTQHHGSAIVLHDPVGIAQEANQSRLDHLLFDLAFASDPEVHHATVISQAIVTLREGLRSAAAAAVTQEECEQGLPDVQTTVIHHKTGHVEVTTRAQRIGRRFDAIWRDLLPSIREDGKDGRAAFEKRTREVLARSHALHIDAAHDYDLWLRDPRWQATADDFDADSWPQQGVLQHEWTQVLEGGPTEDLTAQTWREFFDKDALDPTNPIHRALFGAHRSYFDYLFPALTLEMKGPPDKLGKLYFVIRALIATSIASDGWLELVKELKTRGGISIEFLNKAPGNIQANPRRAAAGKLKDAFFRETRVAAVVRKAFVALASALWWVSPAMQLRVLKVMQAAELLYDRVESGFAVLRMTDAEYANHVRRSTAGARRTPGSATGGARTAGAAAAPDLPAVGFTGEIDVTVHLSHPVSPDEKAPAAAARADVADGLYGLGQFFFGVWALKATWEDARGRPVASNEARLMVGVGALATIGGGLEALAASAKVLGRGSTWSTALTRISVEFVVVSVALEGVVTIMTSRRLAADGDADAATLYSIGAGLMLSAAITIGVATLYGGSLGTLSLVGLGLTGWGLVLVVLGYFFTLFLAESAVDTPLQIWLDRCYWGRHKRWEASGHDEPQRPWGHHEIAQEMNELNALLWGMTAQFGFDDRPPLDALDLTDPLTPIQQLLTDPPEGVTLRLTLPDYREGLSQDAWRLLAITPSGRRATVAHERTPGFVSVEDVGRAPTRFDVQDLAWGPQLTSKIIDGPTPIAGDARSPCSLLPPTQPS